MLSDILRLPDRELEQLLNALSQGRIRADSSPSQFRKAGVLGQAEVALSWLPEAMDQFGSIDGLTAALRLVLAERGRSAREGGPAELILTGPGTDDSPSRDTRVVVREIFESARRSVLIVGYAFHGSDRIFEPLARRMGKDSSLTVSIIVNIQPEGNLLPEPTVRRYAAAFLRSSWPFHPRPEVFYMPGSLGVQRSLRASVHAKTIVADQETVYLGSANFTTAAFHRNIEAGLRLRSPILGHQLTGHFMRLIQSGVLIRVPLD
jgi:phosphatidylserine/phosphatidylglycerophosphate/cardiolipin synthase-like enzyme